MDPCHPIWSVIILKVHRAVWDLDVLKCIPFGDAALWCTFQGKCLGAEMDLSNSSAEVNREKRRQTRDFNRQQTCLLNWKMNPQLQTSHHFLQSIIFWTKGLQPQCFYCTLLQHTWIKWMACYHGCWRCNSNIWFSCFAAVMNLKPAGQQISRTEVGNPFSQDRNNCGGNFKFLCAK